MKLNPTVKGLLVLCGAYCLVALISYQEYIFPQPQNPQHIIALSIIEQFITWIPIAAAFTYLFIIISKSQLSTSIIDEKKLIIPGLLLVLITGYSNGIHTAAQIIEEYARIYNNHQTYNLSFFIDEYIGHGFQITITLITFILVILELNRKKKQLSKTDNITLIIISIISGIIWGIGGVEGGSVYLIVAPITISLLVMQKILINRQKLDIKAYPFNRYFRISSGIMLIVISYWVISHGLLTQPSNIWTPVIK